VRTRARAVVGISGEAVVVDGPDALRFASSTVATLGPGTQRASSFRVYRLFPSPRSVCPRRCAGARVSRGRDRFSVIRQRPADATAAFHHDLCRAEVVVCSRPIVFADRVVKDSSTARHLSAVSVSCTVSFLFSFNFRYIVSRGPRTVVVKRVSMF